MEKYVLKNEDGTQSITTTLNDSEIAIGVWKIKSVKHSFIASLVSNINYVGIHRLKVYIKEIKRI